MWFNVYSFISITALGLIGCWISDIYILLWTYIFRIMPIAAISTNSTFDFIIVGSGSAGSILASRLSTDLNRTVLLLEAGSPVFPLHDIPVVSIALQKSSYDWQYVTEPQENSCFGLKDNRSSWPRGKILGGSSQLNYMVYLRGHRNDYNTWVNEKTGDWTFNDIMYYFKRSENQIGRYKNKVNHGVDGLYNVDDIRFKTQLTDSFLNAANELKYDIHDLNSNLSAGFMESQVTAKDGARTASADIVRKASDRINLQILTRATVNKILFRNNVAIGVVATVSGVDATFYASKSVILSAGSIGSPKILMLSGIGPKNHLNQLNIPVVRDLPVGKNLQDHVTTGLELVQVSDNYRFSSVRAMLPTSIYDYARFGTGPLSYCPCEVVGIINTNKENDDNVPPDLQFMVVNAGFAVDGGWKSFSSYGIKETTWHEYFSHTLYNNSATILPVLLHPKSVGYLKLKSTDARDKPIIQPNYLSHPDDVKTLIKGIEILKKFLQTKSLRSLNASLNKRKYPGCTMFTFDTPKYWECYVRHLTLTVYHPIGTCRMGYSHDKTTVVDHNLKVHGIDNLYVMDASIFPSLPSANTNAAVVMVAEKGADILRKYWSTHRGKCDTIHSLIGDPNFTTI